MQYTICITTVDRESHMLPKCNSYVNVEGTEEELKALLLRMVEYDRTWTLEHEPDNRWIDGTTDMDRIDVRYDGQLYSAFALYDRTNITYDAMVHKNIHPISGLADEDKLCRAIVLAG